MNGHDLPGSAETASLASVLGEIVGLLRQSRLHRHLAIADLDWLVLPPIALRQFFLFRDGPKTIGLALWARCSPETARKLESGGLGKEHQLLPEDWANGSDYWLVDLVAPFATPQNHQRELMLADLLAGPLKGKDLHFHRIDPASGQRVVVRAGPDTLEKIKAAVVAGRVSADV